MEAKIISANTKSITIQVTMPLSGDMLSSEELIQQGVNLAGLLATEHALSRFDTDGTAIKVGGKKYTSKGQFSKTYQCSFGEFELYRHVYQSNEGGGTYCPLDDDGRILVFSTPKFAKMVSNKYSQFGALKVQRDLRENHARRILVLRTKYEYLTPIFKISATPLDVLLLILINHGSTPPMSSLPKFRVWASVLMERVCYCVKTVGVRLWLAA